MGAKGSRVLIQDEPFQDPSMPFFSRGTWPAHWVDHPERPRAEASVAVFQLQFECASATTIRIHVSADNRYCLYLDGELLGRGPERGTPDQWCFETYDLELPPVDNWPFHELSAISWWLGDKAPEAQTSVRPGFLLAAEGEWHARLSTGVAPWTVSLRSGVAFPQDPRTFGTGARTVLEGPLFPSAFADIMLGPTTPAVPVGVAQSAHARADIAPCWLLTPSVLPPMREQRKLAGTVRFAGTQVSPYPLDMTKHLPDEANAWQRMLSGNGSVAVPANTTRCVIIDLGDYYCAYPELCVSAGRGASIKLRWAEALFEQPEACTKGNRDQIEGKYFVAVGHEFRPSGAMARNFTTFWWDAGRYLELTVTTAGMPLRLDSLMLIETGYPLDIQQTFRCSDPRLERTMVPALRALHMCAHETYMDCPYYEQLMYSGDTRLETLVTYAVTRDDLLPRKALRLFDISRFPSGLTQSRFPSRTRQIIPPFSLWHVCMVHDYWMWRDDPEFVLSLLPGVRSILECFRSHLRDDSLVLPPQGWIFFDWVRGHDWKYGVPPGAEAGPSALLNLLFIIALVKAAEMEEAIGEPLLAKRNRQTAEEIFRAVMKAFWSRKHGLLADDLEHARFSEHAQCLAILSGLLPDSRYKSVTKALFSDTSLARCTIYFTHYVFEVLYQLGNGQELIERMSLWFDLDKLGLKTTPEMPEPTRSDCHGWGAHPIYHFHASLAGIRPAKPGFKQVRVAPLLAPLDRIEGILPHPAGEIRYALKQSGGKLLAKVELPTGIPGSFVWRKHEEKLKPGSNKIELAG